MKHWFLINLGDAMLAYDQQERITQRLLSAFSDAENANKPNEMAAFIRHEAEGRLHCEVKIYLSPMLAAVVKDVIVHELTTKDVKLIPCEKPSCDSLSMIAGHQKAWQLLFPERIN